MPDPHRIVGATMNVDRSGILTFKVPWIVSTDEEAAEFSPASGPLGLPIVDRSAAEDNGDWILTLTHEGIRKVEAIEETFELDGSASEDPIETHPDFEALANTYKAQMEGGRFDGWQKKISVAGKSIINPMYGVSAYLNVGAVWRRNFGSKDFPNDLLRELGCIDVPRGKILPPGLHGSRNWLKRSIKATWRGNIWMVSEEWLASGVGGWNRHIYRVR